MSKSNIQQLADAGQSVWLDYIDRPLLETGKLKKLIADGLRGMTSNPSIFNNAIGKTSDYDKKIMALKAKGQTTFQIYDELTVADIQEAADQFQGVYKQTKGLDGYVSLEINPQLANEVGAQIDEGLRLYKKVSRPNVMIKVPSTEAGWKVAEELIANGINVNMTLIFSQEQYEQTANAYIAGLSRLAKSGGDLSRVHSVASFFVSRVDSLIDKLLDEKIKKETDAKVKKALEDLKGKAAVANCRIAFEKFKELFGSSEFKALKKKGANEQRLLWASTSTKNPNYPDIKYVTELISSPTVNTLPANTLDAFQDHGVVKKALDGEVKDAQKVLSALKKQGIDIDQICDQLLADGCDAFDDAFDALFESIDKKAQALVGSSK